jgi:UDP-GlcNAc:undecaprenyl-phosphate GlcNAc-1-phosphate transferase
MREIYFVSFAIAFFVSFAATFLVARFAAKKHIVDMPDSERRFHKNPTPTLGGFAIFFAFLFVVIVIGLLGGYLLHGNIPLRILLSIIGGGIVLMIGGYLDDKYRLSAKQSIIFPILASLVVVSSGISAVSIHNPLTGNVVQLDSVLIWGVPLISGLIVFVWTMVMTYTTKLLDGMDGLVAGISAIGGLVLFALSLSPDVDQPQTALLAITFVGALCGFLILNSYPAKIFLGESGSTFAGFMLAILAIVSGGKIATAILVMGIPILDMIWVIVQRIFSGQSPFQGDRKHLHFRLTELGLSESQAVLLLYSLTGIFGATALFLQSLGKLIALAILVSVMVIVFAGIFILYKIKQKKT